jgi:hypothetical protein
VLRKRINCQKNAHIIKEEKQKQRVLFGKVKESEDKLKIFE